jgi:mono/diheme cytochrome c family protein
MKRRAQSTTILGALVAVAAAVALAWVPPVSADMHTGEEGPGYGGHGHVHIIGHGHGGPGEKEAVKEGLMTPGGIDHEAMGDPEQGRLMFQSFCSACHGVSGKGDGPLAKVMTPKPADLTNHAGHHHAAKDTSQHDYLLKVISGGGASVGKSPAMPKWEGQLETEEICDVIKYIQAFSDADEKRAHTGGH